MGATDQPTTPGLREALNEVVTNGQWTEGDGHGDWCISPEVYLTAKDALAVPASLDPVRQQVMELLEGSLDFKPKYKMSTARLGEAALHFERTVMNALKLLRQEGGR